MTDPSAEGPGRPFPDADRRRPSTDIEGLPRHRAWRFRDRHLSLARSSATPGERHADHGTAGAESDGHCDQAPQDPDRDGSREQETLDVRYVLEKLPEVTSRFPFCRRDQPGGDGRPCGRSLLLRPRMDRGSVCSIRAARTRGDRRPVSLTDEWLDLAVGLGWSLPASLWCFPIETVSQSEGGFEGVYQSPRPSIPRLASSRPTSPRRWEVQIRWSLDSRAILQSRRPTRAKTKRASEWSTDRRLIAPRLRIDHEPFRATGRSGRVADLKSDRMSLPWWMPRRSSGKPDGSGSGSVEGRSWTWPGAYIGARPGSGLAFAELRPYEPGDDVRHMDWNITARQGRPYVRRSSRKNVPSRSG